MESVPEMIARAAAEEGVEVRAENGAEKWSTRKQRGEDSERGAGCADIRIARGEMHDEKYRC